MGGARSDEPARSPGAHHAARASGSRDASMGTPRGRRARRRGSCPSISRPEVAEGHAQAAMTKPEEAHRESPPPSTVAAMGLEEGEDGDLLVVPRAADILASFMICSGDELDDGEGAPVSRKAYGRRPGRRGRRRWQTFQSRGGKELTLWRRSPSTNQPATPTAMATVLATGSSPRPERDRARAPPARRPRTCGPARTSRPRTLRSICPRAAPGRAAGSASQGARGRGPAPGASRCTSSASPCPRHPATTCTAPSRSAWSANVRRAADVVLDAGDSAPPSPAAGLLATSMRTARAPATSLARDHPVERGGLQASGCRGPGRPPKHLADAVDLAVARSSRVMSLARGGHRRPRVRPAGRG